VGGLGFAGQIDVASDQNNPLCGMGCVWFDDARNDSVVFFYEPSEKSILHVRISDDGLNGNCF